MQVKSECLEYYKNDHRSVDPELLEALSAAGVMNFSLFVREDGLLVGYFEAEDPAESWKRVGATDASRTWRAKMKSYFDFGSSDPDDCEKWLEHIFLLE